MEPADVLKTAFAMPLTSPSFAIAWGGPRGKSQLLAMN